MPNNRTLKEILETPITIDKVTDSFINTLASGVESIAYRFPVFKASHEKKCHKLLRELEALANAPASDVNAELLAAAGELLEVANLRGDNNLLHPADDPKMWTARMQEAWQDLQIAHDNAQAAQENVK